MAEKSTRLQKIFRQNLRKLKEYNRLTANELGQILGVKAGALRSYLSGENLPKYEMLTHIADSFDYSLDQFLAPGLDSSKNSVVATFYKRLSSEIKEHDLTIDQVSEQCLVGKKSLTRWTNSEDIASTGRIYPTYQQLEQLADVFGVKPTDLEYEPGLRRRGKPEFASLHKIK